MIDNEIIKALECCGRESCNGCPYNKNCHQGNPMIRDTLDLIKRQQAEIERLKAEEDKYPFKCVMPFNSMICSKSIEDEDYDRLINDIEIDAIKEFAERLKLSFFNN